MAIEGLRRWFGLHTAQDDLLDLMLVARDDPKIREQLKTILEQSDFNRQSLLNTWIDELKLADAPAPLIRALHSLLDNDRALRAREILDSQSAD